MSFFSTVRTGSDEESELVQNARQSSHKSNLNYKIRTITLRIVYFTFLQRRTNVISENSWPSFSTVEDLQLHCTYCRIVRTTALQIWERRNAQLCNNTRHVELFQVFKAGALSRSTNVRMGTDDC